jgi:predicted helicase
MITNNSFLIGLIHRGMREALLKSFDEFFIVNLHGNSNIGETTPNGDKDENVFDIRQGVAILILAKYRNNPVITNKIKYRDVYGLREQKYQILDSEDVNSNYWLSISPTCPNFFFVPKDFRLLDEFDNFIKIEDVISVNSSGIKTHRDNFVVDLDYEDLLNRFQDLQDKKIPNKYFMNHFSIKDSSSWKFDQARDSFIGKDENIKIVPFLYRPFDHRWLLYSENFVERLRQDTMDHMLFPNIALLVMRQVVWGGDFTLLPPRPGNQTQPMDNRVPNLDPGFVAEMENKLSLSFDPHLAGRDHTIESTFGPEDILAYIYAIFHSPTYRQRYAEFLKIDFPRVPLTSDADLFRTLVSLGRELIALHLMESPKLHDRMTHFPIPGDNTVAARGGYPKYTPPSEDQAGRVYINREQYFAGIPPEVWEFEIGGYQVCTNGSKIDAGGCLIMKIKCTTSKLSLRSQKLSA